jgi:small subunit ribosomal protein S4e
MFDIVAFVERGEYYRVFPGEGGRLALTPIDEASARSKLGKIVEKHHVAGGDVQLTLHDGQTLLVEDDAYEGGDSLVVGNGGASADASDAPRTGEIVAHFEYEEGALVTAVDGSHAGEVGVVDEIQVTPGSAANNVVVSQDDAPVDADGWFETVEDYVVVIDENFVEGADTGGDDGDTADDGTTDESDDESDDAAASDESDDEAGTADSAGTNDGGDGQ